MALPDTTFESSGQSVKISGLHEDEYIFNLIKQQQEFYEFDLLDLVRRLPLGHGSVVDVGANLGNHTVFFALIMQRPTHAFEVSVKNRDVLAVNIAGNGIGDLVTMHEFGLHSEDTTASISENYDNMGQTRVVSLNSADESSVVLKRLDSVISPDERIALIKVDVEGGELDVVMGAQAILERDKPVCLVEGHPGPGFEALARFFADHGFRPAQILGRSDNWIFVHADQVEFLLPYIDANVARSQTRALAANETRLRSIQSRADQTTQSLAVLRSDVERLAAVVGSVINQIDVLRTKVEAEAWTAGAHYDDLSARLDGMSNRAVTQVRDLAKRGDRQAKLTNDRIDLLLARTKPRRSFGRWVEDGIKVFTRALFENGATRKAIILFVPKPIRERAAQRLLGRKKPVPNALTGSDGRRPSEPPPSNPLVSISRYELVLVCTAYPGGKRVYGGEFVKVRVDKYVAAGRSTLVIESSPSNEAPRLDVVDGVDVLRILPEHFDFFLTLLEPTGTPFLTHSPSPETLAALSAVIPSDRQFHWFHGYEVRDYRRLYFNYTTPEMARLRRRLDDVNRDRLSAAAACFSDALSTKVFVSDFLKEIAQIDAGANAINSQVIPNFVDGERFPFVQKTPDQVRRMLLIRSFSNRNYANDIAIEAIWLLKDRAGFDRIQFTVRGFGGEFKKLTKRIADLPNVDVAEGYMSREEIAALHGSHGVFLCPTRFDTQGVSMGEAMASGLVVVTNNVTAIPEFTDTECSLLVRPDDPVAYAEALWDLYQHPDRVPDLSRRAAERAGHNAASNKPSSVN